MKTQYLGNSPDAALQIAKQLYPKSYEFSILHDGQENLVIVVDNAYSIRFPRSKTVWRQGLSERAVLGELSGTELPIPQLLSISEEPAYIITSYLKGNHLDATQVRQAPEHIQRRIGEELARFAYTFHTDLPVEIIRPLLTPPSWSYDDYLKRELQKKTNANPTIDALAKRYYDAWIHAEKPKEVIVHDDLHTGNILFDDAYHLVGVLDFGAVCLGSPEQDLRQTYRLGDEIFEAAASTYEQLSGQPFNRELAKLWTITQELASYCREDSETVHKRAFDNLRFWFPEIGNA